MTPLRPAAFLLCALALTPPALAAEARSGPDGEPAARYAVGDKVAATDMLVPLPDYAAFATLPAPDAVIVVEPRSRTVVLIIPKPAATGRLVPPAPMVQIRRPERGT